MVTHANVPTADGGCPLPTDRTVASQDRTGASAVSGERRWLVPLVVIASTAAWLAGILSGHARGNLQVMLVVAGAVLTATAVGLPLRHQRLAQNARIAALGAARDARAMMRTVLEDALDPFVHLVMVLACAHGQDKARLRGEAIQLAVATATQLAGAERVRVCFFALEPGPPRRLVPELFAGRAGAPTKEFTEGTRAGAAALRILESGAFTVVTDTALQRPALWWDENPIYRTFIAGPVATPDAAAGMLTLDALTPGELDDVDIPLIRLIADLLAVALRM